MPYKRSERAPRGLAAAVEMPLEDLMVELDMPPAGDLFFEVGPAEDDVTEISPDEVIPAPLMVDWDANLAEHVDKNALAKLADDLIVAFDSDEASREPWMKQYKKALDLLGLKIEDRTEPWEGACGVYHPLLAEALVRYVSEAILETYPPTGPAETSVIGTESSEEVKKAARVKAEMNYQCIKKMPEDRAELELTLWRQALAGVCFRKVYYDPILKRPRRVMVPAEDLVIQYGASDLWTAPRYTYRFSECVNEVRKKIAQGMYRAYDPLPTIPLPTELDAVTDELSGQERTYDVDIEELDMLEMYVDLDLPGFEHESQVALPYIVTVDRTTGEVVSIYRNHTEENPFLKRRVFFVSWKYLPGFGIYGTGLCQLLGGTADSATSLLRQLVDTGTLSNIPAGFKSRSLRIKGDDTPLRPGELRDVDLPPGMVRQSIEWLPTKDPSVVFVQLLQEIVNEGRKIGSVSDMKIGDQSQGSPVGTTLALIERHLRVISAVQARNNVAMAEELDMLKEIIATEMPDNYEYRTDEPVSRRVDFSSTNIIPVADPSATTMSQRIMRYTAAEQIASRQPQLYDMARLHRQLIEQLQIPNADKIVPLQDDFVPQDPVTENMRLLQMRPVKAFINQDHEAHIATHVAAMQDPLIMQLVGQSPNAAAMQAAAAAHVQEHIAYAYRDRIQKHLGFALPDPDAQLPPEMEAAISRFVSEAAQKVLQESQATAAQQKAAAEAQDPMIQLKKLELELKNKEMLLEAATEERKAEINLEIAELRARVELARIKATSQDAAFSKTVDAAAKRADIKSRERVAEKQRKAKPPKDSK